jgi:hypothetical protein
MDGFTEEYNKWVGAGASAPLRRSEEHTNANTINPPSSNPAVGAREPLEPLLPLSVIREARYFMQVKDILQRYSELLKQTIKVDFTSNATVDAATAAKNNLILEYFSIAKHYTNINPASIPTPQSTNLICSKCSTDLVKQDDLQYVCMTCGAILNTLANVMNYQEDSRINSTSRYLYKKQGHFRDTYKKFQGKQNTTIPDIVFADIKKKMQSYNITHTKLTKDHLVEFLKSTGHNKYIEDINLIYHKLTGYRPPDISHLESAIDALYEQIEPVYIRIKPDDRTNFMNGQFVLFKLLQKLRYPCTEEDFNTLKTRDNMIEHDTIWKQICNELCWTYIPTI